LKKFLIAALLIAGLGNKIQAGEKQNVVIEVKPVFSGKTLSLSTATYVTSGGDTVSIERFRYYLSGLVLTLESGEKFSEPDSYHLVDAEDPSSFRIALANVPAGKITSVTFNVGVDSTASVSGALSGALDPVKGMYWAWNSGYINAKLEGSCKNKKKNQAFEFHIGGYLQPYYALRSVQLNVNTTSSSKLILQCDAAAWFNGVDLKKENSIMIPGKEAMEVADRYSKMFSLVN
jgi:hypothetical protein